VFKFHHTRKYIRLGLFNTGYVGSNPSQGMYVCSRLSCVLLSCVGRGPAEPPSRLSYQSRRTRFRSLKKRRMKFFKNCSVTEKECSRKPVMKVIYYLARNIPVCKILSARNCNSVYIRYVWVSKIIIETDSSISTVTGYGLGYQVSIPNWAVCFLFATWPRPPLGPAQPHIKGILKTFAEDSASGT
jgi:hypothetical protein